MLTVDWELDLATLRLLTPRGYPHFLECYTGPPSDVAGASLALCMFQLSESELPGFSCGIGVLPADGVRLSADARHLLYACPAYAGDSGAAFLMADEHLIGVHVAFVNQLRENFERKRSVDERLTGVEVSLEALVAGAGRGTCVALLASQLESSCRGAYDAEADGHQRDSNAQCRAFTRTASPRDLGRGCKEDA